MLQQTRVETVVPYYERFVARFPDLRALAIADEEDVLREWSGLGYYARARNLKRAAEVVLRDHGGRVPRDPEALRALPGVGRYTAGAISSIAFRKPAPLVDGNVARVLSRFVGERRLGQAALWRLAEELVPPERPDLFNQALMELGATVCAPRAPRCSGCPLQRGCRARAAGNPEDFPARPSRRAPREVSATSGVLERRGARAGLLLLRRPSRGLLGGLWELPTAEGETPGVLVEMLRERTDLRTRVGDPLGRVRHLFSHRALTLSVVRLERLGGRLPGSAAGEARWLLREELARLPLSVLMRKALALAVP